MRNAQAKRQNFKILKGNSSILNLIFCLRPRLKLLYVIILIVLCAIFRSIRPFLFKFIIDGTLSGGAFQAVMPFIYGMLFFILLEIVADYISERLIARLTHNFACHLRQEIFGSVVNLPFSYLRADSGGQWMARIVSDIETLESALKRELKLLIDLVFSLFACLCFMLVLSPKLFFLYLVLSPLISKFIKSNSVKLSDLAAQLQKTRAEFMRYLHSFLNFVHLTKAYSREEKEKDSFNRFASGLFKISCQDSFSKIFINISVKLSSYLLLLAVITFGAFSVINNRLSLGAFIAFLIYFDMISGKLSSLMSSFLNLQQGAIISENLRRITTLPSEDERGGPNAYCFPSVKGKIDFSDVSFIFPGNKCPLLRGISFSAGPGERVALVGPSGAGKTTLVSMIPGFLAPSNGIISIDERDIQGVNPRSLRRHISMVFQENVLLNCSIAENIAYSKECATEEEIIMAAKLSLAHEFIEAFPGGYSTIVGENATMLSGGECQRIAIARAILKRPAILILDESTSYLSDDTEKKILDNISKVMKDTTMIIITHRVNNIAEFLTKILLLDNGVICVKSHLEYLEKPSTILNSYSS